MTASTSPPPQASTQLGTSLWVLDSGAFFHISSDSSVLSSLRPLDSPVNVLTADGTPLPVTSRGLLSTPSFSVPSVSHVPRLTMNFFPLPNLLILVVVSFLIPTLAPFRIVAPRLWLVLARAL